MKLYDLSKLPKKVIEILGADCSIYLNFLIQRMDNSSKLTLDSLSKLYPNITEENISDYQGVMITRLDIMSNTNFNVKRQQRMFEKLSKYGFIKKVLKSRPATCLYVIDLKEFELFCGQNIDHLFPPKCLDLKEKRKVTKEKRKNIIKEKFFLFDSEKEKERIGLTEFFSLIPKEEHQNFYEWLKQTYPVDPEQVISKFCKFNEHKLFSIDYWIKYLTIFCKNCRNTVGYEIKFTEKMKINHTLCVTLTERYQACLKQEQSKQRIAQTEELHKQLSKQKQLKIREEFLNS